jgi:hypothetical protein
LPGSLRLHLEGYARLSPRERASLEQLAAENVREAAPRRDRIREGSSRSGIDLVLDGWACRSRRLPDGRRQVVAFFIPGDLSDATVFVLRRMDGGWRVPT